MSALTAILIKSFLTEKFLKIVIIKLLEILAKKTDNKIDDELVAAIKGALNNE